MVSHSLKLIHTQQGHADAGADLEHFPNFSNPALEATSSCIAQLRLTSTQTRTTETNTTCRLDCPPTSDQTPAARELVRHCRGNLSGNGELVRLRTRKNLLTASKNQFKEAWLGNYQIAMSMRHTECTPTMSRTDTVRAYRVPPRRQNNQKQQSLSVSQALQEKASP